jgi:hypothetical protein
MYGLKIQLVGVLVEYVRPQESPPTFLQNGKTQIWKIGSASSLNVVQI